MTNQPSVTVEAAHAAAAAAIEKLYDEAMSHIDAVVRSIGLPAEESPVTAEEQPVEPQEDDATAEPATAELPHPTESPVAAAA
ncbi:hypothetical protein [Blastococcus sp. SYSU DS0973]